MAKEIERKFLVDPLKFLAAISNPVDNWLLRYIDQGYLSDTEPVVRIRISSSPRRGDEATLTVKGPGLLEREEIETTFSLSHARQMLELSLNRLKKTRYTSSTHWEVDVFHGSLEGLVMAEREFSSVEDAKNCVLPPWVTEEVTEDARYSNVNLAKNGKPSKVNP